MKLFGTGRMTLVAFGLIAAIAVAMVGLHSEVPSWSATANPTAGSVGNFLQTFTFDAQLTSDVTDKVTYKMPWPAKLVNMKCAVRALGGSSTPTYTWTLKAGTTTLATCAPTTNATEVEATISNTAVADESVMHLNYASTGSSPTADDATVVLVWKRQ